ncbi:unnamed protein product [Cuscuta epithymum]|uniref:Serine aminopeptidase S33 domain-containing protein n=1 Tax=Cuscuta epithymum TaxID=186058 RepID=A0AAV0FN38_9ASTE|nr:unnamed protein product [Cuscuta epithymum]
MDTYPCVQFHPLFSFNKVGHKENPFIFLKGLRRSRPVSHNLEIEALSKMSQSQPGDMLVKKVSIRNRHAEKLVGLLHDTGSPDIAVLCHGFRSSKSFMKNIAAALEKEGISAFRFDFSGNGESEGEFHYGHYQKEADDLHSVVEHFIGEKRRVVAILGHSKGGSVVILYASRYHDVEKVINVSGRYDLRKGIAERLGEDYLDRIKKEGFLDVKNKAGEVQYRVTEESLMDRLNTDLHKACLQIDKGCRVFTIHGSNDDIIPVEDAFELDKVIQNHKLHIIEGASHDFMAHQDDLISTAVSFIKE